MNNIENYLTITDIMVITGKSRIQIIHAMRKKKLKSYKLNVRRNGVYFSTMADVDEYLKNYRKRAVTRCIENCNHEKKTCNKCKKSICVNDFHIAVRYDTPTGKFVRKRPYCKDCDLLYQRKR